MLDPSRHEVHEHIAIHVACHESGYGTDHGNHLIEGKAEVGKESVIHGGNEVEVENMKGFEERHLVKEQSQVYDPNAGCS